MTPPAAPSEVDLGLGRGLPVPFKAATGIQEFSMLVPMNSLREEDPEAGAQPEDLPGEGKGLSGDGSISHDCALNTLSTHSPPIVLLWNQGQPGSGKKETKMSIQVGAFCRETAMADTEKRESSPFPLYVRISLKLPIFAWTIKYSIKNPSRGKSG